jgi:hypothetical protein
VLVLFLFHLLLKRGRARADTGSVTNRLSLNSQDILLEGADPADRHEIGCASCE